MQISELSKKREQKANEIKANETLIKQHISQITQIEGEPVVINKIYKYSLKRKNHYEPKISILEVLFFFGTPDTKFPNDPNAADTTLTFAIIQLSGCQTINPIPTELAEYLIPQAISKETINF